LKQKIEYIKSVIASDLHSPEMKIIYGGSVNPGNVKALKQMGILDGFFIGKAGLDVNQMQAILGG
jgi:triosephosphate isomerase